MLERKVQAGIQMRNHGLHCSLRTGLCENRMEMPSGERRHPERPTPSFEGCRLGEVGAGQTHEHSPGIQQDADGSEKMVR